MDKSVTFWGEVVWCIINVHHSVKRLRLESSASNIPNETTLRGLLFLPKMLSHVASRRNFEGNESIPTTWMLPPRIAWYQYPEILCPRPHSLYTFGGQ